MLRRITSKRYRDFYCLNCLHFFRAKKNKLESHTRVYENKDFCTVIMLSDFIIILLFKFNQYLESDKARFIIYADLEYIIERLMDLKLILKNHLQQNEPNIFHQVFQYLQYIFIQKQNIGMMYAEVKIV